MSRLKYLVTACVLALTVGTANAATYVVTGVTGDPQIGEILEGTVDVTNGAFTSANFQITNFPVAANFTSIVSQGAYSNVDEWLITVVDPALPYSMDLYLQTPEIGTLTGYNGGPIVAAALFNANQGFHLGPEALTLQGSLTPTPLPAALPLFASGLGASGLLGWRRKRKNAAAIAA
jgi:hypothetical protein